MNADVQTSGLITIVLGFFFHSQNYSTEQIEGGRKKEQREEI